MLPTHPQPSGSAPPLPQGDRCQESRWQDSCHGTLRPLGFGCPEREGWFGRFGLEPEAILDHEEELEVAQAEEAGRPGHRIERQDVSRYDEFDFPHVPRPYVQLALPDCARR